jgi:hypothetical protein
MEGGSLMDKDRIDAAFLWALIAFMIGILALFVYYALQPTASDGWYDALCYGEVVDTAAGPSCLTDEGTIKLMPKYENRTN